MNKNSATSSKNQWTLVGCSPLRPWWAAAWQAAEAKRAQLNESGKLTLTGVSRDGKYARFQAWGYAQPIIVSIA